MTTAEPRRAVLDMADEALVRDPFRGYDPVREWGPLVRAVMPGVEPMWLLTRFADVREVLRDRRFVVDPKNVPGMRVPSLYEQLLESQRMPAEYRQYRLTRMVVFDRAEHARLRDPVSRLFTAQRAARLRPRIEVIAERLLDRLPETAEDGVADLLHAYALPLSGEVLCELVGIPPEDRRRWRGWATDIRPTSGGDQAAGWREVVAYTRDLMRRRRAEPADDLISKLVEPEYSTDKAYGGEGPLTETEIVAMIIMLGLTSQVTGFFLGNALLTLLTHPDQLALLLRRPELLGRAVDELLRWCTPTLLPPRVRYATEDVEIAGMPVRKGEAVCPSIVAANHDPRRFADPGRLDVRRDQGPRHSTHLAFGGGDHRCLGEAVARQESEVGISALLSRFPGITLAADPAELPYERAPGQWSVASLPVRL